MQTSTWLRRGCVLQSGIDSSICMTPTHKRHTWKMRHDQVSIYVYTYNIYEVSESPTHTSTVGTNRAGASTWAERSMTNVRMITSSCLYGRWGLTWFVFFNHTPMFDWYVVWWGSERIPQAPQISVELKRDSLSIIIKSVLMSFKGLCQMALPYMCPHPKRGTWISYHVNHPQLFLSIQMVTRGWSNGGRAK